MLDAAWHSSHLCLSVFICGSKNSINFFIVNGARVAYGFKHDKTGTLGGSVDFRGVDSGVGSRGSGLSAVAVARCVGVVLSRGHAADFVHVLFFS